MCLLYKSIAKQSEVLSLKLKILGQNSRKLILTVLSVQVLKLDFRSVQLTTGETRNDR